MPWGSGVRKHMERLVHKLMSIYHNTLNFNVMIHTNIQSGLTEASRQSKISVQVAQEIILDFVSKHTNIGECPLAGNSIGEDKRFLNVYMPKLISHFHYRIIDVSTIKELCR